MEQIVSRETHKIYIRDKIVIIEFLSQRVSVDIAKQAIEDRLGLIGGETHLTMVDVRKPQHFEKEARQLLSGNDAQIGVSKAALLINSKFQEILANFFIFSGRIKLPIRAFSKENDAVRWLKS